jgi:hypothetical protein
MYKWLSPHNAKEPGTNSTDRGARNTFDIKIPTFLN